MIRIYHADDVPDGLPSPDVYFTSGYGRAAGLTADGEWVLLVQGTADLRVEGEDALRRLIPGSFVHLPAHCRHRVEAASASPPAIWLAVHYGAGVT